MVGVRFPRSVGEQDEHESRHGEDQDQDRPLHPLPSTRKRVGAVDLEGEEEWVDEEAAVFYGFYFGQR